jgi:chromosome segregation ATPase
LKDLEGTNEKMAVWEERHGDLKQLLDKADTEREGLNTEIKKLVSENAQKEAEIKESKRSLAEARTLLERTRRQ